MGFHRPTRLEGSYRLNLQRFFRSWVSVPPKSTLEEIVSALRAVSLNGLHAQSKQMVGQMVSEVARVNAVSWREAARQSMQGRRIYDLMRQEMNGAVGGHLRALIEFHSERIRSLPEELAQDVASQIATRQQAGERADTIAKDIQRRLPEITKARIALIARTQVASTATDISRVRAEHLNLPAYEWITSQDGRVRPAHKKMNGVIVFWNDPPSPEMLVGEKATLGKYQAGQSPNCRCDCNVVVDLEQISFPARVYRRGSITSMTRRQFSKIYAKKDRS